MADNGRQAPKPSSGALARAAPACPAVLLGLIVASGLAVRFSRVGDRSYWYDEGFSWKVITFPCRELVERVAGDTSPPLYYLVLKAWASVAGDSPFALRSLSVLLGGATIVGMFLFAREAFRGERANPTALLTAAMVAASVFQINWSCEARMYALGTALAAFSSWQLLRALRRPDRAGRWVAYVALALPLAYTHYYALFTIAAQLAFAFGFSAACQRFRPSAVARDRRAWLTTLAALALALGYLPWLPGMRNQTRLVREDFWIPPVTWSGFSTSLCQMFMRSEADIPHEGVALVAAEACLVATVGLLWRGGRGGWFTATAAWVPFAASVAVSVVSKPVFHTHCFLFAHLFFLAGIAALVGRLRPAGARLAASAAVVLVFAWVSAGYVADGSAKASFPGARGAAAWLDAERQPGEPVVVCSPMLTPSMEGHSRNREGWRTFFRDGYLHFHGTAIVRPGEYVTSEGLDRLPGLRFWAVDVERWDKGDHAVPQPLGWARGREKRFREIYGEGCEIKIREYVRSETVSGDASGAAGSGPRARSARPGRGRPRLSSGRNEGRFM